MLISHLRNLAAAAAVAAGSLAFMAAPVGAQECGYPMDPCPTTTAVPTPRPDIDLSKVVVRPSETISATVIRFAPGTLVLITTASVEQQVGSVTMPASGSASVSITIPSDLSLGAHTVFARGTALDGQPGSASEGITVVGEGAGGTTEGSSTSSGSGFARTGAVVVPTALVGLGLVVGGVALKRSSKRGKSSTAG